MPQASIVEREDRFQQAIKRYADGDLVEAERLFREVVADQPQNAEALNLLGMLILQKGDSDRAVQFLKEAVVIEPQHAMIHNNLGIALSQAGQHTEAEKSFRTALKIQPAYSEAWNNLGNILKNSDRYEAAAMAFEEALKLNPTYTNAQYNYGNLLKKIGSVDRAKECYQAALAIEPKRADIRLNLGNLLKAEQNIEGAIAQYADILSDFPDHALALYNLADGYRQQGKFAKAAKHYRRYLECDSTDRYGATLILAALGILPPPQKASAAHMEGLYDERAPHWEHSAVTVAKYAGHEHVADAVGRAGLKSGLKILDIGCGTGLVGALVRERALTLTGVDLSPQMLAIAAEKQIYDTLHRQELTAFLDGTHDKYDLITGAAILIHFGDLAPVFRAIAKGLAPQAIFIGTFFPAKDETAEFAVSENIGLMQAGCYEHGSDYIKRAAGDAGFTLLFDKQFIHEYENSHPIEGILVALKYGG